MHMLLKSKEIAFVGILMAIGVILVTVGGYFEGSTLFFLAAASYLTGIVQRNLSVAAATAFLAGTTLLSFFLAPQKLYCATFLAFGVYVVLAEFIEKNGKGKGKKVFAWVLKGLLFHGLLFAAVFLGQKLFGLEVLFEGKLFSLLQEYQVLFWVAVIACAEIFWVIFDRAYFYFQNRYGGLVSRMH